MSRLDSLCANTQARSVVELSLNPAFERDYTSLYAAIEAFMPEPTARSVSVGVALYGTIPFSMIQPMGLHSSTGWSTMWVGGLSTIG